MYETGTPDVLSVIVGSNGYDELATRAEYLDRIHGMDEAVVGRVRDLRDQVRSTVARLRSAKNRIEAARDAIAAEEQALAERPPGGAGAPGDAGRGPRRARSRRWRRSARHEEELDGDVAAIQGEIAATLAGYGSAPLPAGPIQPGNGSGLIWPVDGAGRLRLRARDIGGSYEYHPGIDIAVPERDADPRRRRRHRDLHRSPKPNSGGYGNYTCIDHGGGLSTCYAHQ